ncbi:MAG: radical SAM protein [Deltaproteobacteria bacterium]|nr:radical SAM protein [Deltaproteobacteria bacterium]
MRTPTIEWQVVGACNRDCSYCIQSRHHRRGRPTATQLEQALSFFAKLSGPWEIKCSGGEVFAHRLFMAQVVPGLMERTPHQISVLTNFSASRRDLMIFARSTRERLAVFSASLHLQYTSAEVFAEKASWFADQLGPDTRFVVNQVVLPGREAEALHSRRVVESHGLRWFPQLYKVKGGVAAYPDEEALREVIGDHPGPRAANTAPSYKGRMCWSGVAYFAVDRAGDAWSCRTARRHDVGHLGNVFEGTVHLHDAPRPCPWDICPCTVPANRGMIAGVGPAEPVPA